MRIKELLENFNFKEEDFVKQNGDKRELDYDLVDDLIHYMHNDDHVYRRKVYPVLIKCIDRINGHKSTDPEMFAEAVKECYKSYAKKFPIRELPDELDEDTCEKTCKKMHDEIREHVKTGKYKD